MIVITYRYDRLMETSFIKNVWEVSYSDVEKLFLTFICAEAEKREIVCNPHWKNIMNHKDHHPHLTEEEYKQKEKEWKKYLRMWNVDKYIAEILKGTKLNYEEIHK